MHHLKKNLPQKFRFLEPGWWIVHLTGLTLTGILTYLVFRDENELDI